MGLIKEAIMDTECVMIKALDNYSNSIIKEVVEPYVKDLTGDNVVDIIGDDLTAYYEIFCELVRVEDLDRICAIWHIDKTIDNGNSIIYDLMCNSGLEDFFERFEAKILQAINN